MEAKNRIKISKDFYRDEFACPCGCGFNTVDTELSDVMQDLRDHYGVPITKPGGCRCLPYNSSLENSSDKSRHMWGQASDPSVPGVEPIDVYNYLDNKYSDKYGIGVYDTFVHIDVRAKRTRWDFRTK